MTSETDPSAERRRSLGVGSELGRVVRALGFVLGTVWTSPNTLLGLLWSVAARGAGGGIALVDGVIETHGPGVAWSFDRMPNGRGIGALTLGQVVLARSAEDLARTRRHERVHVGQYLRWGPLFLPAYFLASGWVALRGGDPYRGNPFEVVAYAIDDCRGNLGRTPRRGNERIAADAGDTSDWHTGNAADKAEPPETLRESNAPPAPPASPHDKERLA